MKTAAFQLVAGCTLAAAVTSDDRLFAYESLQLIAKALGLKREAKRLRNIIRALRIAEAQQAKFTALLDGQKDGKDGGQP